jgi:hypothetical protein
MSKVGFLGLGAIGLHYAALDDDEIGPTWSRQGHYLGCNCCSADATGGHATAVGLKSGRLH